MKFGRSASKTSAGPGDVCDARGRRDAARSLVLRAGVQNVTCVREIKIKRIVSFHSSHPPRLAISYSLARVSDVLDGYVRPGPLDADAAVAARFAGVSASPMVSGPVAAAGGMLARSMPRRWPARTR